MKKYIVLLSIIASVVNMTLGQVLMDLQQLNPYGNDPNFIIKNSIKQITFSYQFYRKTNSLTKEALAIRESYDSIGNLIRVEYNYGRKKWNGNKIRGWNIFQMENNVFQAFKINHGSNTPIKLFSFRKNEMGEIIWYFTGVDSLRFNYDSLGNISAIESFDVRSLSEFVTNYDLTFENNLLMQIVGKDCMKNAINNSGCTHSEWRLRYNEREQVIQIDHLTENSTRKQLYINKLSYDGELIKFIEFYKNECQNPEQRATVSYSFW